MSGHAATLVERLVPDTTDAGGPAHTWLRAHGLPTGRDEAWRYTPLERFVGGDWEPAPATPHRLPDLAAVDALAGRHGGPRIVLVDGTFVAALSDLAGLPAGVRVDAATDRPAQPGRARYDGFQAMNGSASHEAAVVTVAAGVHIASPIHVVHLALGGGSRQASHPRTVIELEPEARATVIESHAGTPGQTLTNAVTTITVARGAALAHHRVVNGAPGSVHIGHTGIDQDAGSRVRSWSLLAGADIARSALDVVLHGERAEVDLQGLHLPVRDQHHDTVVTVEHAASGGRSRQRFQGVVDDRARGSFSGHVIVAAGTTGNDAGQTNRNLLLRPTAQADTRPWLEIFADDVRCTHGATVGRLDDEALFYLRTRGIPRHEARSMLVGAFVAEVTEAIELASLRSFVEGITAATTTREDA